MINNRSGQDRTKAKVFIASHNIHDNSVYSEQRTCAHIAIVFGFHPDLQSIEIEYRVHVHFLTHFAMFTFERNLLIFVEIY